MTNKLKEIMKKEFDEDKNYNAILSKVERVNDMRKSKNKYFLVPTIALMAIISIILGTNIINQQDFIGKEESILDIFTLKVYAAEIENTYLTANYKEEIEEKVLSPEVELLLANYSPLMNSVPGFPLKIELNNEKKLIDEILITTDNGEILIWNQKTGEVQTKEKTTSISDTNTLYWSPSLDSQEKDITLYDQNIWKNSDIKTIGKINILAQKDNKTLNEKVVYIGEANYNYYAILK